MLNEEHSKIGYVYLRPVARWIPAVVLGLMLTVAATPARAQVEVYGFGGYSFSEGVKTDPGSLVGAVIDEVNATSGGSFGAGVGVFISEQMQLGFQWSQQDSALEVKGTTTRELTSLAINSYHGVFTYNLGSSRDTVRPFLFAGGGATSYSPDDFMGFSIDGETQFSTTWGGGVKIFPSERVGFSATGRFTPTYIKSDPAGIYCTPYWSPYYPSGCAPIPDADYSNQFEMTVGINIRLGG